MEDRTFRTRFAIKALDLADVFRAAFEGFVLPGSTNRTVVLTIPEGQSTAGGAQANQSISLVPEDRKLGILVAGTVHGGAMTAELRGYSYIRESYRLRYHGKDLDVSEADYAGLLDKAKTCLAMNGFTVTVVNHLPQATKKHYAQQAAKPADSSSVWIVLVILLIAGAATALVFLVR